MRKIQNIAFVLLATLFAGCINDHIENTFCRDGVLTLNLSTSAVGTRADGTMDDGGDSYHPEESTIYDIQLFLYPANSTETTPAVYATKIDVTPAEKPNHDTTKQTVTVPAGAINDLFPNNATTCDIYVIVNYNEHMKEDLTAGFTDATSTREYLKGRPLKTKFVEIDEYGDVWAPRSFVMDSDKNVDGVSKPYTVTRNEDNSLTSETIYVTRAAAKIAIEICVESFTDAEGNRWEALTDVKEGTERYMTLDFFNGVKEGIVNDNSHIDATGKDIAVSSISDDTYYSVSNLELLPGGLSNDIQPPLPDNTEGSEGSEGSEGTEGSTPKPKYFVPEARLYSYTTAWGDKDQNGSSTGGAVTNSDETYDPNADAPHFKLSIPWKKTTQNSESWVTYNYTVPIGLNLNQLVRNKLYVIRLHVSALGNLNLLDESVYSYKVCEWDEVSFEAELTRPKYFVVDEEYVEIYNKDSYSVNFSASDVVSAEIVSIIKPDYSDEIPQEYKYIYGNANSDGGLETVPGSGFSGNTADFKVVVDEENNKITLSHTLVNDMEKSGFDYVPYTVKVKATMTITDSANNETYMVRYITFKQFPAMYVYADTNSSYTDNDGDGNSPRNTYVNGYYGSSSNNTSSSVSTSGSRSYFGSVPGLSSSSSNQNPNQYVLTVSSFSDDQNYIIADPRSRESNTTLGSKENPPTWATAPSVNYKFEYNSTPRTLQFYYPTIEDLIDGKTDKTDPASFVTGYHIAPKFRIASSYSVVTTGQCSEMDIARRRCASYQENGFPAGRWRLPTFAEIELVSSLSRRQLIPYLFTIDYWYWSAHGPVMGNANGEVSLNGANNGVSVRCVYDEWYWGNERLSTNTTDTPNFTYFVWGDMKIW